MLEIKNLSFAVEEDGRQKEILRNLNLTIDNGKFVVITGPNGSGKSTLARLIMGIEKPTEGNILFDGKDVTELDITERAKLGISFAFQQPVRFKGIRVKDLLRLASGKNLSVSAACDYLSEVGFDEPEAGIDLWSFRNLTEVFQRLREDIRDSSILIISHQERILNIADEILLLSGGTIQDRGTPDDIMPKLVGQSGTCVRLQ